MGDKTIYDHAHNYSSWIPEAFKRVYPDADTREGLDFNHNGKIEANERITDANANKVIGDHADWLALIKRNYAAVQKLGDQFRWGGFFKRDNPIHDAIAIERALYKPTDVQQVYRRLKEVLSFVRQRLNGRRMTPQKKLATVYKGMRVLGYKFAETDNPLFMDNVIRKFVDCDTSSLVVLAVAHEFCWPVALVNVPRHVFVRYDDGKGTRFNIDYGKIKTDNYYRKNFLMSARAVERGVYMCKFDRARLLANIFALRGAAYILRHNNLDGIIDNNTAIKLAPNCLLSYLNRIVALMMHSKYDRAIRDIKEVMKNAPNQSGVYGKLAQIQMKKGGFSSAFASINRGLRIDPNANLYAIRAQLFMRKGRYYRAYKDYDNAISKGKHKSIISRLGRALAKAKLGDYGSALEDCDEIIETKKNLNAAYVTRAEIKMYMGKYRSALADLKRAANSQVIKRETTKLTSGVIVTTETHYSRCEETFLKARIYDKMGKRRLAVAEVKDVLSGYTRSVEVKLKGVQLLAELGRLNEALVIVGSMDSSRGDVLFTHAQLLANAGRYKDAMGCLEDIKATCPTSSRRQIESDYRYHELAAQVMSKVGQHGKAARAKATARRLKLNEAAGLVEDAALAAKYGDYRYAIKLAGQALAIDPRNVGARYTRGQVYAKLWKGGLAKRDLKLVLVSGKAPKDARAKLKRLYYVPHLHLDLRPRIPANYKRPFDFSAQVGATWSLVNMHPHVALGAHVKADIGFVDESSALAVAGGTSLISNIGKSSLTVEVGAGYNILLQGDQTKLPFNRGGFMRYGLRYDYKIAPQFGVGVAVAIQQDPKDPRHIAVMPGVEFMTNLW